jgi:hypothetical protein
LAPARQEALIEVRGIGESKQKAPCFELCEVLIVVMRRENPEDRRMRERVESSKGKAVTDKLDQARERLAREIFQDWAAEDVADLVRLMRNFAEALELGTRA